MRANAPNISTLARYWPQLLGATLTPVRSYGLGVWRCAGPTATYFLKRRISAAAVTREARILRTLTKRGIAVAEPLQTVDAEYSAAIDAAHYCVTHALPGSSRATDFANAATRSASSAD